MYAPAEFVWRQKAAHAQNILIWAVQKPRWRQTGSATKLVNIDTHAAAGRALEAFLTDGVEPTGPLPPALLPHGVPLDEPWVGVFVSRTSSTNRLSNIYAVKNCDRYANLCLQLAYVNRMDHNSCRIFKGFLGGFKISQNITVMNPKNLFAIFVFLLNKFYLKNRLTDYFDITMTLCCTVGLCTKRRVQTNVKFFTATTFKNLNLHF